MKKYEALIFDMNGTMIDDMAYHETAWYNVLVNQLKAPLTKEQVKSQVYGKQHEMFHRIFGEGAFTHEEITRISDEKEARYREEFLPHLQLIDGLDRFLEHLAASKIPLAIGTAAPVENIDFVLDNLGIRKYFPVIVGPHHVTKSKPDPEVFLMAARLMNIAPENCLVFEDVPHGIEAARRAGMDAVGVSSFHTAAELQNTNVIGVIKDYYDPMLQQLV